jgi:Ca2+-binding RTX toxin-like protein
MHNSGFRGVSVLFFAAAASYSGALRAADFDVDSTVDEHDANLGDGVCETASGVCTFRAAVEQANALSGADNIFIPANASHYSVTKTSEASGCCFPGGSPCMNGYPLSTEILDYTQIFGAGQADTILDGEDKSPILRARTWEVVVTDNSADRIVSHRYDGFNAGTFIPSGGLLDQMIKVAPSPNRGDAVIVSTFNNGVLHYLVDGTYLGQVIPPTVDGKPFVAYDFTGPISGGDFLVANGLPGGGIMRFGGDFSYKGMLVSGDGFTSVEMANFVKFTCDSATLSTLLVADGINDRVLRFDEAGNFVSVLASSIPLPRDIAVKDDEIFVSSENANSVVRFKYDGSGFLPIVFNGSAGLSAPQDIDIGPNGELFVSSHGTNQILRYDRHTGDFIDVFTEPGNGTIGTPGSFTFVRDRANGPLVNISGVTLANGRQGLDESGDFSLSNGGAGIFVQHGALVTLTDSTVRSGWGNTYGGGVSNHGTLFLTGVSVLENETPPGSFGETAIGGGIFNKGQMFIKDSLIADNFSGKGAGISAQGEDSRTDIVNTTITGNLSNGQGGGVRGTLGANININHSTITKNQTNYANGTSTPTQKPPYGGGIFIREDALNGLPQARVSIANSIVAGNINVETTGVPKTDPNFSPDCYAPTAGVVHSYSDNLIGVLTDKCSIVEQETSSPPTDLISGTLATPKDPELMDLGNYGGDTLSFMLKPTSPAVDRDLSSTSLTLFNCTPGDQRGVARPIDGDGNGTAVCDLGSIEKRDRTDDFDGDGIDDNVDTDPVNYSFDFQDTGNTHGTVTPNSQIVSVVDSTDPQLGVTISTDFAGGSTPALISLCNDKVLVQMGPGESQTFTCVTANAGPDQSYECTGNGRANVTLSGSGASLSGAPVTFSWLAPPTVTLENATSATTGATFPVGTNEVVLFVTRDVQEMQMDSVVITVTDSVKPVLTVPPDVFASSCTSVSIGSATATDACSGTIVPTNNAPSSFKAGVYTITWTATDPAGNSVSLPQKVTVGLGDNQACCPTGSTVRLGDGNNNTITGTSAVDCILGKGGQDTLRGMGGNDIISGGEGDDVIEGGDGDDTLAGDAGQDILRGQNGNDSMSGGNGDDQCFGGENDDTLFGGAHQDRLYGENGNDRLYGEDGTDRLEGAAGNDTLNGGASNDTCLGGTGTNTLVSCEL